VRSYKEVLEDPQSIANGYITEVDIPGVGLKRTIGNLVTLSETPGSTKGPPPGLGEGNEELLTKAGLSVDAITHVTQSAVQVRERLFEEARVVREALQRQIEAQHRQ
jgi:crotonobetainyl-CoA:carnitine CoA-transferase CaiB-like acyl-CoA transferase